MEKQDTPRSRSHKGKLIGHKISVPSTLTPETIRNEWKQMIQSGEISIGISCVPYQMKKFMTEWYIGNGRSCLRMKIPSSWPSRKLSLRL